MNEIIEFYPGDIVYPIDKMLPKLCDEIVNLKKYQILGHLALCEDFNFGLDKMKYLPIDEEKEFGYLAVLARINLCNRNIDNKNEFYVHSLFNKHISSVIEGATITKKKMNIHHQPDAFIKFQGQTIPVEMKYHSFDKKALKQLQRYCKSYKSNKGVAVGSELTVKLPPNYIFVSNYELYDLEDNEPKAKDDFYTTPLKCAKSIKNEIFFGILEYEKLHGIKLGANAISLDEIPKGIKMLNEMIMSTFWDNVNELFVLPPYPSYPDQSTLGEF